MKRNLIEGELVGRAAKYKAVLTQKVCCVQVLSITILCPQVVGKLVFLTITHFAVVKFF